MLYAVLKKRYGTVTPKTDGVYSSHEKAIERITELRASEKFCNHEYGVLMVQIDEPFPEYPHFVKINTSRVRL